jgi:DNA-binding protein HU-beta
MTPPTNAKPGGPASKRALLGTASAELRMPVAVLERTVEAFLEVLKDTVWQEGRIHWPGFGVFRIRRRKARKVNAPPGQKRAIKVAAFNAVTFTASKTWRNDK